MINGRKELNKSVKIYSKNKKLHIFAREPRSYNLIKENFKNNVYLVPDMVLYMANSLKNEIERDKVLICLRNEKEKLIQKEEESKLLKEMHMKYTNIIFQDTGIKNEEFNYKNRYKKLEQIINSFMKSRIVITDRLHGMIFCAITGTPCIVFPNNNHKIKETYDKWLKDLAYINFIEDFNVDKVIKIIEHYINKNDKYLVKEFSQDFKKLEEILKEEI